MHASVEVRGHLSHCPSGADQLGCFILFILRQGLELAWISLICSAGIIIVCRSGQFLLQKICLLLPL